MEQEYFDRHAPLERRLSDGLDFYKLTMGQVALAEYPDAEVTFTLKNRTGDFPLGRYITEDDISARLNQIRDAGFSADEIEYFKSLQAPDGSERFGSDYIEYLENIELPDVAITTNAETGDFDIQTTGPWPSVSLWETVVMSELNELYFQGQIREENLSLDALYDEGDRRLTAKIEKLGARPDIKFIDFGTRRRFSAGWHEHVVGRLVRELPDNLVGTSNPWFAHKFGIKPVGTYAHEMPMVYAGLEDAAGRNPLGGHTKMLRDWEKHYGDKGLTTALTDTFTSDFFFEDFSQKGALDWSGLRHDSGDPVAFGEQAIRFYESYGVNPMERTLVFSDGLDIDEIIRLTDYFADRVKLLFGWGTTLTNDLGLRANNIVMKATNVNGKNTVKLSDVAGKHTGPEDEVRRYVTLKNEALALARESTMVTV